MPPTPIHAANLMAAAREAHLKSYSPYSGFSVGAAVQTDAGIFAGTNVENVSFGATICAERVAIVTAIAAGARVLLATAVVADFPEPCPPCGVCRQVLYEFGPESQVYMFNLAGDSKVAQLSDLLPTAFEPRNLLSRSR